jgi:hypothetical protein
MLGVGVDATGVHSRYGVSVSGKGLGNMDGISEAFSCVTELDGIVLEDVSLVTHFEAIVPVTEHNASGDGLGNALAVGAGGSGSGGATTALLDLVDFLQTTFSFGSLPVSLS